MSHANSQLYLPNIKDVTETTWAYFAGLIDGEGHINIYRNSSQTKIHYKDGWRRDYILNITNNSTELLEIVQKKINLGQVKSYYYNSHSTKQYKAFTSFLRFDANSIRVILPKVLPYLVLKREMAEIMLKSLKVGETDHSSQRKERLKALDVEFRLAFLKSKGNKPYTNNHNYWNKKRVEKGRPLLVDILERP
jgi:hypothetical protein